MADRRPQEWLQPDEEVLLDTGRHPLSVLDGVLGTIVLFGSLIGALWVATGFLPILAPWALSLTIVLAVVWLGALLAIYWRVKTSRYVLTSDRVYRSHGRLRFMMTQTTYDKVTDLHVHQSLFGRIWGFGTVTVQTAGTGLGMQGVREPAEVKRRLERARRAFIERLLEEHGVAQRDGDAGVPRDAEEAEGAWKAVPRDEDVLLWRGGPVAFTLVPPLLSGGLMVLVGIGIALGTLAAESGFMFSLFGILLVLFGVTSFGQAFVQYRYMRYEVRPWGVVVTSGWLSRRRVETTFDKVTDVSTYQNFIGRMMDYGNIKVNTAGSNQAPVNFNGLAHPERVKAIIDDARRERNGRRAR